MLTKSEGSMQNDQQVVTWALDHEVGYQKTLGLLEGFSGVGKSKAVTQLLKAWPTTTCAISAAEGANVEDLLFELAMELESQVDRERYDFQDFAESILLILKAEPVLIVIDDFDQLMDPVTGSIDGSLGAFLARVRNTAGVGRLLVVSSRRPSGESWTTNVSTFTLSAPGENDAINYLQALLRQRGLDEEIPPEAMPDVVAWLGRNPNAMQAFVSCLVGEPFEELVNISSEAWELRSSEPTQALLVRLQELFWKKTLGRLSVSARSLASSVSVLRRPYRLEALAAVGDKTPGWDGAKNELTENFLLERRGALYQLNPVARQLLSAELREDRRRLTGAQARAGNFYASRSGSRASGGVARISSAFVEARYHLSEAGQLDAVQELAREHRHALLASMASILIDGTDTKRVRELTPVLIGVLDTDAAGLTKLRELLVRLLILRAYEGDGQLALRQAAIASRDSRTFTLWRDYVTVAAKYESPLYLSRIAERSRHLPSKDISAIARQICLCLLDRAEAKQALDTLEESLKYVDDPEKVYLFSVRAYVVDRQGLPRVAVRGLLDASARLPAGTTGLSRLYEEACFIAYREGNRQGLGQIAQQAAVTGVEASSTLANMLLSMLDDSFSRALDISASQLQGAAIRAQAVFCKLVLGQPLEARDLLAAWPTRRNKPYAWLSALVSLCCRDADSYSLAVGEVLGRAATDAELADPVLWARLWQASPLTQEPFPGFYYPRLPSRLTGLANEVVYGNALLADWVDAGLASARLPILLDGGLTTQEVQASVSTSPSAGQQITIQTQGVFVSTNINNGNAGAVGDGSTNHGDVGGGVNIGQLQSALEQVLLHARVSGLAATSAETLETLQQAKQELENGDEKSAKVTLRKVSVWLGEKLTNAAVGVSAGAILRSLGY